MEETLTCLRCGNAICTCGEAYRKLNNIDLLVLINNLVSEAIDRNIKIKASINDVPITNYVNNKNSNYKPYLLDSSVKNIAPYWRSILTSEYYKTVKDLWNDLISDPDKGILFPSALLLYLYLKQFNDKNKFTNVFFKLLSTIDGDEHRMLSETCSRLSNTYQIINYLYSLKQSQRNLDFTDSEEDKRKKEYIENAKKEISIILEMFTYLDNNNTEKCIEKYIDFLMFTCCKELLEENTIYEYATAADATIYLEISFIDILKQENLPISDMNLYE